jgi:hypothetical protein
MAWYNKGKASILNGAVDLLADTIKVILVNNTYVFDADHNFVSQVSSTELSGTGYAAGFAGSGRKTLAGKAVNEVDASDYAAFDANDVTWTAILAGTAAGVILVKEVTVDGDSLLIAHIAFSSVVTNGGDLTLQWDANGILQLT